MHLSRSPDFVKLWSGYTIAVIGSQITVLALPLTAILLLGASATETGLLVAARMAPALGLGLLIGAWVDRLPRRPIMIASDIGSALVIGSVPAAAALGILGLPQLYVIAFLAGAFAIATESARTALVPTIVGRDQLVTANTRLQGSSAVAWVAGPSLAGVLVQALTPPTAMLFDALTFLASAALLARVRVRETVAPRAADSRVWHEIVEGVRWMRGHPVVFRSVVAIALANIEWYGVQAILVIYATRELALPPVLLGIAIAAMGPLSLVGVALVAPLTARWGLGRVMIAALFLETLSRLLLPFASGTPIQAAVVLAVSQALIGLTEPLWNVTSSSLQQVVTPERLLGRVTAATRFIGWGVVPPAALGAGVLADAIGLRPTLFVAAVIAAIAFVYLLASPVRRYRQTEPVPA